MAEDQYIENEPKDISELNTVDDTPDFLSDNDEEEQAVNITLTPRQGNMNVTSGKDADDDMPSSEDILEVDNDSAELEEEEEEETEALDDEAGSSQEAEGEQEEEADEKKTIRKSEKAIVEEELKEFRKATDKVSESDRSYTPSLTLRQIIGGGILDTKIFREQVGFIFFCTLIILVYVGLRYKCQKSLIDIAALEVELKDARYKALSSSSELTEKTRESQVLYMLKANNDTIIQTSKVPPFIINIPDNE